MRDHGLKPPQVVDAFDEAGRPAKGIESKGLPVVVDFLSAKLQHRVRSGVDSELVVKVFGVKKSERKDPGKNLICDFTAGLGVDSFLLANAGFKVISFERDPRVFALLEDGLKRFLANSSAQSLNLQFRHQDVAFAEEVKRTELLATLPQRPFAVYLDPMYEDTSLKSKSLPKKEMAVLRQVLAPSSEQELGSLLATALWLAESRVVVKRPMGAPPIEGARQPAHRHEGKTACFDVYTCRPGPISAR
ncbi:MAG: class I SAM-dependent methyltransferase [Deltaproteobacteria bacterium]|nr:class I SAM-dependent methyltransferase [Deltaproteobacteria bacterium]